MAPLALLQSYGISTPYLVDRFAPSNMVLLANQVVAKATEGSIAASGWLALCLDTRSVITDDEEVKAEEVKANSSSGVRVQEEVMPDATA